MSNCTDCGRVLATEEDEAAHNTGECACSVSRALCWRKWNGDECEEFSPYDPAYEDRSTHDQARGDK